MCLWESTEVDAVQRYVDEVLGDLSKNTCYEVDTETAFAEQRGCALLASRQQAEDRPLDVGASAPGGARAAAGADHFAGPCWA